MQRRNLLKLLTSTAALSSIPLDLMLALQQARAETGISTALRALNPHQNSTVITLSELIIPETDTPGAKGAKVNEFIDLLLTEWFETAEKTRFLDGLATIDTASRKRFSADFISCTPAQQIELMKQFDDEAMKFSHSRRPPTGTRAMTARTAAARITTARTSPTSANAPIEPGEFFYSLKKLTIFGYYTTEIGFSQELGDSIIPPGHEGCAPLVEIKR